MKYIIKYCICLMAVTCLFTACNKDLIDPLTGKYPPPEEFTLTTVNSPEVVKQGGNLRIIKLQLNSSGASFYVEFMVNAPYLRENAYTMAPASTARNGNYIAATFTKQGGSQQSVVTGIIDVKLTDEINYTISGVLQLTNNTFVQIYFKGEIYFEPEPPEYVYTLEVEKPYGYTDASMNWVTIPGSQLNKLSIFSEGLLTAYLEIVTEENTTSLAGDFPVKEVRTLERAIVQGAYLNLLWFGMWDMVIEGGSYFVDDEIMYIREGDIKIADNNEVLTITSSNIKVQDLSTEGLFGNLPAIFSLNYLNATKGSAGGYTGIELKNLLGYSTMDLSGFGGSGYNVTVKLSTEGLTGTDNGMGGINFSGSGNYVSIDFRRDVPTLIEGTYKIVPNDDATVGDAIAGYPAFFGTGNWGSVWGTITNGAGGDVQIKEGEITVSISGSIYTIEIEVITENDDEIMARYIGPLAGETEPEEIILTNLIDFNVLDLSGMGMGITITTKLSTSGVTSSDNGENYSGTGNYISIDFKRDSEDLIAGTYNIVSNTTAQVGDAIAGYPAMWGDGNWGSVWGTVATGAASEVKVTGGVVTVSIDRKRNRSIYTIEIVATTEDGNIKAKYVGPLSNDEPEEITLSNLINFNVLDLSGMGMGITITTKLSTSGVTSSDNGENYSGTGNYISIDFKRDSEDLIAGTYNIVSNTTAQVGDAIAGYPAMWGDGNWGSVWGTVTAGAVSEVKITGGVVKVSIDRKRNRNIYTIEIDATTETGAIKAKYTGPLSDEPQEIVLANLINFNVLDLSGMGLGITITTKLSTSGVTSSDNGNSYSGTGNYISIDFKRDSEELIAGNYNIVPNESAQVGDAIAGYPAMWGDGNWGSVWGTVTAGAVSEVKITGGVVKVNINRKRNAYTIEIDATTESGTVKAKYTGNLE